MRQQQNNIDSVQIDCTSAHHLCNHENDDAEANAKIQWVQIR